VVRFSDLNRVEFDTLLEALSSHPKFEFQKQILGYYYDVEIWKYSDMDVVLEEADLAHLELAKQKFPDLVHELVFHPNGKLASTWQPWDGVMELFEI
jgi:hypothetical protein